MGGSEAIRAGVKIAKGGDPIKAGVDAITHGAIPGGGMAIPGLAESSVALASAMKDDQAAIDKSIPQAAPGIALPSLYSEEDPLAKIKRRSKTLLTGGLGVPGDASVVRKTLLGG